MLMVLTLTLGLITPPVGVCLFVACRIGNLPVSRLVRALVPFFIAELGVVLLIILFPGLSSVATGVVSLSSSCLLLPGQRMEATVGREEDRASRGLGVARRYGTRMAQCGMIDLGSARITDHARLAMARREIAAAQVREVLRAPQAVVPGNRPGRQVAQGSVNLGDRRRTVLLRVVVDIDRSPPEVVTAYATTQFARYGATR